MKLCQPYYIERRTDKSEVLLDGVWEFCYADQPVEDVCALSWPYRSKLPLSVYRCLFEAGVLPDPYFGTNSKQYHWVDEKVWYFSKTFVLDRSDFQGNAYLCFDGVSYYSRVWLNGHLLGEHEGMFGGPCCDVAQYLCFAGENSLTVEVKACNYGKKQGYDFWNSAGQNPEIVPWNIIRDTSTSNGDFITFGIWNHVRLELLPLLHMSRPYLRTESASEQTAQLHLQVEIADGRIPELHPYYGRNDGCYEYTRAYDTGLTGACLNRDIQLEIEICDGDVTVYRSREHVDPTDYDALGMDSRYYELQFFEKQITLESPKLWYPNNLGEAHLYQVNLRLFDGDTLCDTQNFPFGIRTFTASRTKGRKYRTEWGNYQFSVNGKPFFLKGMNWTPIDFLYDISPERYEWCLTLAKNAGIQMIRVWNGGGMPETDDFYAICDRLGLLVWQDQYISNTVSTASYPLQILECQCAYNLYRLRNHPSLVILCGGNEFNPYTDGNAAAMLVISRTAQTLAPDRVYYHTTADRGSAHIYIDMEPVWYRHRYRQLPFLAESGIHSFPSYHTFCQILPEEELRAQQIDLLAPDFRTRFPGLMNHFSEYIPERVRRMTARMSQILNMHGASLEQMCQASQVQVYEFYQLMIQSMRENYPVCGGVMPWVFKRPWPTVGVQTVDGDDRPGYGYYAVQNAYRPLQVCWCQQWSVLAPEESLPLQVKVFCDAAKPPADAVVTLTVYAPDLRPFAEFSAPWQPELDFGVLQLPQSFTDTCFLVCADIGCGGTSLSRSVYFNKCTSALADPDLYAAYREAPKENLYFDRGPWLKDSVTSAGLTKLRGKRLTAGREGAYAFVDMELTNEGAVPAYPVTLESTDMKRRVMLSRNFFLLKPGETVTVRATFDRGAACSLKVTLWNSPALFLD